MKETKSRENILLTDFDRYLLSEGTHEFTYEKLGGHLAGQGELGWLKKGVSQ